MLIPNIQSEDQITDKQVNYLAELAVTLSTQNDFAIQNYADSVITRPEAQQALQSPEVAGLLNNDKLKDLSFDIFSPGGSDAFALSLPQENSIISGIWPHIKSLFTGLRRKVSRIFCKVVTALGKDEGLI